EVAAEGHAVERVDLERDEAARDDRTPGVQVEGAAELVDVDDTTGEAGHADSFGRRTRCDPDHIRPEGGPGHIPLPASVRPGGGQRATTGWSTGARTPSSVRTRRAVVMPVSMAPSTTTPFHPLAMSAPAKYSRVSVSWKVLQPSMNWPDLMVAQVWPLHLSAHQSWPSLSRTVRSGRHWLTICCTWATSCRSIAVWSGPKPTKIVVPSSRKYSAFIIALGLPVGAVAMKLWCPWTLIQILKPVLFVCSSTTLRIGAGSSGVKATWCIAPIGTVTMTASA